jgi:acetolactate synthase regulatory subunit
MSQATTRMYVRMSSVEGALIRLLGLAGRRGFDIAKVDARRTDGGKWYEIVLELGGTRCAHTLSRQIAKLYDVDKVEIVTEPHVAPHAAPHPAPLRITAPAPIPIPGPLAV